MPPVVQARCPGCQKTLRIPANWIQGTLRCKHCGTVIQAKPKAPPARPRGGTDDATAILPAAAPPPPAASTVGQPAPAAEDVFAFGQADAGSPVTLRYRRRRRGPIRRALAAAVWLLVLCAVAGGVYQYRDRISRALRGGNPDGELTQDEHHGEAEPASAAVMFPRRILAISVNNYLFANPVTYGSPGDGGSEQADGHVKKPDRSVHAVLSRLGDALHVPDSQRLELSDSAPGDTTRPPLKSVIEGTVTEFFNTSRAQDRLVLLFVGHAVEIGDEAYLVPIEGELRVKETLISLRWLLDRLAACKARQKVLILDVCRFDPARGVERPNAGPMGPKLDAALANPPAGVQVWSACVAGQHSYEGYVEVPTGVVHAGFFLDELFEAVGPFAGKHVNLGIQQPQDALPIETLAAGHDKSKGVDRGTAREVDALYKEKQTPRLAGQEAAGGAAYNPAEPLPERLTIRLPAPPPGGAADRNLIADILREVDTIPPVKAAREGIQPIKPETLPFFSAKVMEKYRDDGARTPLREAVRKAIAVLKDPKVTGAFLERFVARSAEGKATDAKIKEMILRQQRQPAIIEQDLKDALAELREAGKERDASPRWQANYNYVLARLEARIANVHEYNYMLGQIRKDALPPRDPKVHSGWQLASREKLQSDTEAKKMAADSQKILARLAKEHKGTPWEILAKRDALTVLGLEWKPTR
jgi:hypothetical protein